jgi:ribosomal protein L11 methyltransferase
VENTRHNATLNGVDNIEVLNGDIHVLSHVSGIFDVVLANINRNVLLSDMEAMKGMMADGGRLLLSGFYESDVALLQETARRLDLKHVTTDILGGWVLLSFKS